MSDLGRILLAQLDADDVAELRRLIRVGSSVATEGSRAPGTCPLLTVPEAAQLSHCNIETVRRAVRSGKLSARKVGRCYRIDRDDLEAWLGRTRHVPESPPSQRGPQTRRNRNQRSPMRDALGATTALSHYDTVQVWSD